MSFPNSSAKILGVCTKKIMPFGLVLHPPCSGGYPVIDRDQVHKFDTRAVKMAASSTCVGPQWKSVAEREFAMGVFLFTFFSIQATIAGLSSFF